MICSNHKPTEVVGYILMFFLTCVGFCSGQQLEITSPPPGTVFSEGDNIDIRVSAIAGQVSAVQVGIQDVGLSSYSTNTPFEFSLVVPAGVVGPKNLFALGVSGGTVVASPVIMIDIEPRVLPTAIEFRQKVVRFGYTGDQRLVGVLATFSDGSTLDVSRSKRLSFVASNSLVALDSSGRITSKGPGTTTIAARYGSLVAMLKAIGPTGVRGDIDGDGRVTVDDLLLLEAMLGSTITGPTDGRDLNGDGKINQLDVQALLAICGSACPTLSPTVTNLTISGNQFEVNQPVVVYASITGSSSTSPTGSVCFLVDGQIAEIGVLGGSNHTSVTFGSMASGSHSITALYTGDVTNAPSSSSARSIQVTP